MRRSSTAKDVTTLVKGSSEATSLPAQGKGSRLDERRKSEPLDDLINDIQKINIGRSEIKTWGHRNRSYSRKT